MNDLILVTNFMWKEELIAFLEKRPIEIKNPILIEIQKVTPGSYRRKDGSQVCHTRYAIARQVEKGEVIDQAHRIKNKNYKILPISQFLCL